MKITYIAMRSRDGKFYCYDVIVDGLYLNLFISPGSPVEKIAQYTEEWLANPFPDQRRSDSISVVMAPPSEDLPPEDLNYPEDPPSMKWTAVEMQNYLGFHGIGYSDGDTKKVMLVEIKKHFG